MKNRDIDKFDNLELEEMSIIPEFDADFDKYIEAQINKRLRKAAFKAVAMVMAVLLVVFCCISPVLNMVYPNACKLNQGTDNQPSELYRTISTYLETVQPLRDVYAINVEKEGFGEYKVDFDVLNGLSASNVGVFETTAQLKRGKWTWNVATNNLFTAVLGNTPSREDLSDEAYIDKHRECTREQIEKLPESEILMVDISSYSPFYLDDLIALQDDETNDPWHLEWVRVYIPVPNEDEPIFHGGVRMCKVANYGDSWSDRKNYTGEDYLNIYIENLNYLKKHQKLLNGLPFYEGNSIYADKSTLLTNTIRFAEMESTFKTSSFTVSGSKNQIMALMDYFEDCCFTVLSARTSIFE